MIWKLRIIIGHTLQDSNRNLSSPSSSSSSPIQDLTGWLPHHFPRSDQSIRHHVPIGQMTCPRGGPDDYPPSQDQDATSRSCIHKRGLSSTGMPPAQSIRGATGLRSGGCQIIVVIMIKRVGASGLGTDCTSSVRSRTHTYSVCPYRELK